jgi:curved DNA-binding protein CbpA
MPRPMLPADDLYARLEVPRNASPEAIEIAWRALLRRHHPDIAGDVSLERAKLINIAHDWLSDPGLRDRYDRERGIRGQTPGGGHRWPDPWTDANGGGRATWTAAPPPRPPADPVVDFLERVSALNADELDRLAAADPAPIAFGATIRRFVPDDRRIALESIETEIARRLSTEAAARPGVRDTINAYAAELVLGSFLDDLLSEPFRARTRERLTRGWEAAVGQPRYGPNGPQIRSLVATLRGLDRGGVAALAAQGARDRLGDDPWPPGTSPDDDEALRVSSVLAAQDAAVALPDAGLDRRVLARARRAAARIAHLLVLRHTFAPATYADLTAPWRPRFLPDDPPVARVRRPPTG